MRHTSTNAQTTGSAPAIVWFLWAVAAAASIQLAPNPLYVTIVVAICALVVQEHGGPGALRNAFPVLLAAGVIFGGVRLVLTALTTHGVGSALFHLPVVHLPRILGGFEVGGSIEADVVARAAAEGWAIVGIIAAFAAFNAVVSHHELVQAAPRAFYELGLAVTVALAFVPSTIGAITASREADRARTGGHVVRRGRLLRQVVPVLETGLERAVALAESMDSRGFGRDANRADTAAGWLGLGGLLLLAGSFVALVGRAGAVAGALVVAGILLLGAAVVVASKATRRVRYRPRRLTAAQWALGGAAWAAPVALIAAASADDTTLRWPGDVLHAPTATLVPLIGLLALAVPALATRRREARP